MAGLLLAGCSGETVIPQADGTRPVLPAGHAPAADPPPSDVLLRTDHGRHSPGVVASGGSSAPYNYAPSVLAIGRRLPDMWWCSQLPGTGAPR